MSAYTGGSSAGRFFADWPAILTDPNDDYWLDGAAIAARSWDLWRNDPYFRALIETMVDLTIGAEGLTPKSQYQDDIRPETTEAEQLTRDAIDNSFRTNLARTRLDAGGILTYPEMSEAVFRSCKIAGMGYSVRVWRPNRPDTRQGSCWRVIDPARVSNPNYGADTQRMFQGHELDADGREVAIHIQKTHPNIQRIGPSSEWVRVPIYKDGLRNVTIRRNSGRTEAIRTLGAGACVLLYLRMLQGTTEAWAIAKRIQASYALMIETENPAEAARADRYGSLLTGNAPTKPGMRYYHNHKSVTPLNWNFQGADYEQFRNPIIEAVCAAEGVPYEMVLKRMTKSNMASSRTSLMQAYQYGRKEQNRQVMSTEQYWAESVISEDIARGVIVVRSSNTDDINRLKWKRPPRPWPDPQKEANAVQAWVDMGHSYTSAYDEVGKDFEEEVRQRARDERLLKAQGITVGAKPAQPVQPAPVADPEDEEDDEPQDEDEPQEDQDMKPSEMRAMLSEFAGSLRPQAQPPLTVVNEQRISMDADSARLMGVELGKAIASAPATVVNVAPAVVNMEAAAAPSVTVNVEPSPVHVQAAATPEPVAPIVNVNLPAPVVTIENQVIVPSRTVIAEPIGGGRVKMTPQES
jgi:lambda family phage portal protein